jgi:hypothetical protein
MVRAWRNSCIGSTIAILSEGRKFAAQSPLNGWAFRAHPTQSIAESEMSHKLRRVPVPLTASFHPPPSPNEGAPQPSTLAISQRKKRRDSTRNRLLRLELLVLILSAGIGCFVVRTFKQDHALQETGSSHVRSLLNLSSVISNDNLKIDRLTNSVEGLTKSLAQSTFQINDVSGRLELDRSIMNRFETRVRDVEAAFRKRQEAMVQGIKRVSRNSPTTISEGASLSNRHSHPVDLSIPLPAGFVAHRNGQHDIDYWMVPQIGPSGEFAVRVQPYGANALGVLVHGIDDGKDYILTKQGGWTEIPTDH